jgi:hypothetical protein
MFGICAQCGVSFEGNEEDVNDPGGDFRGPKCSECYRQHHGSNAGSPSVVALRDAKFKEPCVEVKKLRSAGQFHRWCIKHHHWLNESPAQETVLHHELGELSKAAKPLRMEKRGRAVSNEQWCGARVVRGTP